MQFVPGHNERERPYSTLVLVGYASPRPGVFLQRLEECNRGRAHQHELLGQVHKRAFAKIPSAHVVVLLESLKRRRVAARDPQSAICKNSLRISYVTQYFLYRPFVWRVAKITVALGVGGK